MWIVRWVLIALLILIILGFALQNQQQTVSVKILNWKSPVLPLYIFLYISFGAGLLFWVLISMLNMFKLKGEIHQLQRENRKARDELNRLRNASIEEEEEPTELEEDQNPEVIE